MLRISDVDAAIRFYADGLGMTVLERIDIEAKGGVTALFVGYDADGAGRQLELSFYRAATEPYTHGSGFGHVAIEVPDLEAAGARLDALGIEYATTSAGLSVNDPDGHQFLLSRG
jgi:lactoylglutathione lyase